MLTNKVFWRRLAAVAAAVWIGLVAIVATGRRDFDWTDYRGDFGPAAITAIIGVAVIMCLGFGVPWIGSARNPPSSPPG